ncbi:MAG: hypothetical protein WC683_18565 [bacterium]
MTARLDFAKAKTATAADLARLGYGRERNGHLYGRLPGQEKDHDLGFNGPNGFIFYDFTGRGQGSALDLVMVMEGCSLDEAARILDAGSVYVMATQATKARAPTTAAKKPDPKLGEPLRGVPLDDCPRRPEGREPLDPEAFQPGTKTWCEYRLADGQIAFGVLREDRRDGKRIFQWSLFRLPDGSIHFRPKGYAFPSLLWRLDLLAKEPDALVTVCEGEKAASALRLFEPDMMGTEWAFIASCWPGGSKAIGKVDLSPLYGRKVTLWPDADECGVEAMAYVAQALKDKAKSCAVAAIPNAAHGYDAADLVRDGGDPIRVLREAVALW